MKSKKIFLWLAVSFLLILSLGYGLSRFYKFVNQKKWYQTRKKIFLKLQRNLQEDIQNVPFRYAILIKDFSTGYKFAYNEEMPLPAASLLKVPIMACVYCANEAKKIDVRSKVVVKDSYRTAGSGILKNLSGENTFEVEELVRLMIAYSDNTATNVIIDLLGFDYLNNCFKNLGLESTFISRKILDRQAKKEGKENYTSAEDVGYILEKIYKGELINKEVSGRCLEFLKEQKIADRIPRLLPADVKVAHKTGLENGLCHDAGIIFSQNGDFLICVLTQHKFKTAYPAKHFISKIAYDLYYTFNK